MALVARCDVRPGRADEWAERQACERAVLYVLEFRHPEHVWGYAPKGPKTTMSVTGWAVQVLWRL